MVQYTEIAIKFVPPVLDMAGDPVGPTQYLMEIITPASSSPGLEQAIPQRIVKPIPIDQTIRLQLMASDLYYPKGRYQVNYYIRDNPQPVLEQIWVVPHRLGDITQSHTISSFGEEITLPDYYFGNLYVDWSDSFEIVHNKLVFLDLQPPVGTTITMTFTKAATLDELVEHKHIDGTDDHFTQKIY